LLDAVEGDARIPLEELRVDGGAAVNDTLMQFQADLLGVPVVHAAAASRMAPAVAALIARELRRGDAWARSQVEEFDRLAASYTVASLRR
jgi:glycerol kinase